MNMNQNISRDTSGASDQAQAEALHDAFTALSSPISLNKDAPYRRLSIAALVAGCLRELQLYRQGEPSKEAYGLELLRRATTQGDAEAWAGVQDCFHDVVRIWLRCHPAREAAYQLESEENYIAQAFERFWQATALNQQLAFSSLATALQYLRASLYGTVSDTRRMYARAREIPLPEPGEPGEPQIEEHIDGDELWEALQTMLPDMRERRLAYLFFHCGLKPREIIRFCPREFSDIREIYCLRRNIMERLRRNADQLRRKLAVV
jgi:hypothetical protein